MDLRPTPGTILDTNRRSPLAPKIKEAGEADDIFPKLMGDVVKPRREFIQNNSLSANVDVWGGGTSRRPSIGVYPEGRSLLDRLGSADDDALGGVLDLFPGLSRSCPRRFSCNQTTRSRGAPGLGGR